MVRISGYQDEYYLLLLSRIEPQFLGHPVQYTNYTVLAHNLKYKRTELSTVSIPRGNLIRTLTCKLGLETLKGVFVHFPRLGIFFYHYK